MTEKKSEFPFDESWEPSDEPDFSPAQTRRLDEMEHEDDFTDFEELQQNLRIRNSLEDFSDVKPLGVGGIGTVFSGRDPSLGREVAIKILRADYRRRRTYVEKMLKEAKATAQLEHPNIVPVHEFGFMDEAGVYFTMKKVSGEALCEIIEKLRLGDPDYIEKYPRIKLLNIFISVCQGVAFAHSKGIIHRDLKPGNILVGEYGEVLVLDWGLVKKVEGGDFLFPNNTDINLETHFGSPEVAVEGMVSGTPFYMSPDQALGRLNQLDQRDDVFSLGIVLYELVTLQHPFEGESIQEILGKIVRGSFTPPRKRLPKKKVPKPLEAICMKAMAHGKNDRYQSAEDLIDDITNYLGNFPVSAYSAPIDERIKHFCLRHSALTASLLVAFFVSILSIGTIAVTLNARYKTLTETAFFHQQAGDDAMQKAVSLFKTVEQYEKQRIGKFPDTEEIRIRDELGEYESIAEANYNTAMMLYSGIPGGYREKQAESGYQNIMTKRINYSLMTKDYEQTRDWLRLLEVWLGPEVNRLPESDPAKRNLNRIREALKGDGTLTVITDPPGAELFYCILAVEKDGRYCESTPINAGKTPVQNLEVAKGSYMLTAVIAGRPPVVYPVIIRHSEKRVSTITIPETIPGGMVYIPGGPFLAGGEHSRTHRLHEEELSGFFIKKYEVTFSEYMKFWNSLSDDREKQRHRSMVRLNKYIPRYLKAWDDDGNLLHNLTLDLPVIGITKQSAEAYCLWLSRKTGRNLRLPSAYEWEKAARGVDGRIYVWGDVYNPRFAFTSENPQANDFSVHLSRPGSFPADFSIWRMS